MEKRVIQTMSSSQWQDLFFITLIKWPWIVEFLNIMYNITLKDS